MWTYTLPSNGEFGEERDSIRFLLRDIKRTPQSLQNEELDLLIAEWQAQHPDADKLDRYAVAATAADMMADAYLALASGSKSVGNVSLTRNYNGEAERFRTLARRLEAKAQPDGSSATGRMKGMGLASRSQPPRQFSLGQMDNGWGGGGRR